MRVNKEPQDLSAINDTWEARAPSEDDLSISDLDDLAAGNDGVQVKGGQFGGQTVRVQFRSTSDFSL